MGFLSETVCLDFYRGSILDGPMKTCFKCRDPKPPSAFYKHPQLADGRLGKCKECTKADARAYRKANLEKIKEYDRKRGLDPKRKKMVRERYHKRTTTKAGREREWARTRSWIERNILKRAAHVIVGNAIRDGRLIKGKCERCGTSRNVQSHHEDYEKPMDVVWLCRKHHGERHREINAGKRND